MRQSLTLRQTTRAVALLGWLAGNVGLWLLLPPVPRRTIHLPEQCRQAVLSPDGGAVATLNANTTGADDGPLRLWDVATGQIHWELPGDEKVRAGLRFTPDGSRLVVLSGESEVEMSYHCYDVATGRERFALPCGDVRWLHFQPHYVGDYSCFSPDGGTFYYLDAVDKRGVIRVCDAASGALRATLDGAFPPIACSPDGQTLAVGLTERWASLWDIATLRKRAWLVSPPGMYGIHEFRFSHDGRTLSGRLDVPRPAGTDVALWDVATGQLRASVSEGFLGFLADGETWLTCDGGPGLSSRVAVRDVTTGEPLRTYPLVTADALATTSPDGRSLAAEALPLSRSAGRWPWLQRLLRRIEGGESRLSLIDPTTGRRLATVKGIVLTVRPDELFAADGRSLLTICGLAIHVWDVPPRKPLALLLGLLAGQLAVVALVWRWRRKVKLSRPAPPPP